MIDCVMDIKRWSHSHRLKLNAAKSEVIWIGTSQQLSRLSDADKELIFPDGTRLSASTSVRNLGVQIDEKLKMDAQVMSCCRSCYYHMRRIRQVRHLLNPSSLRALVVAFVLGRIDYCNSLYAGCSKTVLQRLQRVQDAAARLVHGASRLETAMPLIRELHWLPVPSRIQHKLSMLMYDVFHGVAPGYLVNLCRPCGDARLRSTSRGQYVVPFSSTVVRAEVLSHHWTKGLELLAGPCSHSSISNNFCQQTENTSLHTRIFTLVSIFCTVVWAFNRTISLFVIATEPRRGASK